MDFMKFCFVFKGWRHGFVCGTMFFSSLSEPIASNITTSARPNSCELGVRYYAGTLHDRAFCRIIVKALATRIFNVLYHSVI